MRLPRRTRGEAPAAPRGADSYPVPSYRRGRLAVTVVLAVIAVVAVSVALAWRQYRNAQQSARSDLRSRTAVAADLVDVAFAGDVSTLLGVARSPTFRNLDLTEMGSYLRTVSRTQMRTFNAGLGWIDAHGEARLRALDGRPLAPVDVRRRTYVKRVLATRKPYVSGGLIGTATSKPAVVVAVPTFGRGGRLTGVLGGAIELRGVAGNRQALQLGFAGLAIVDRNGRLLFSQLTTVANESLLRTIRRTGTGTVSGVAGLDGEGNDVVAYATAPLPSWAIVIDRPSSSVYASARHALVLQIASVVAVALLVFATVAFVLRRWRREQAIEDERALAWTSLSASLTTAATPDDVAAALVEALGTAFRGSMPVVVLQGADGRRTIRSAVRPGWATVARDDAAMESIARLAVARRQTIQLDGRPALAPIVRLSRGYLRCLHTMPMSDGAGRVIGGAALVRGIETALEPGEWTLFDSLAIQAAQALERSRAAARDHELAERLQRSLLPDALPEIPGLRLGAHYRAGAEGVDVGGDWYDAIRRGDGVVLLCIGDVIGRGVGAAMLMGRLRDAVRAHALELSSPGEIVRRMVQHTTADELMITLACVAVDPYTRRLTYSCAGHPPPLLIEGTSRIARLEGAVAPPLGVADAAAVQEATAGLEGGATVVLYTDGVIERRGISIDDGIDALGRAVAEHRRSSVVTMVSALTAELGSATDDAALLVARFTGEPVPFDVRFPASAGELGDVRRRLAIWLGLRGFEPADCDDVLLAVNEACNNAIEHGYRDGRGLVHVLVDDDGATLRATIRDEGSWRTEPSGKDRGRGTTIMRATMDVADVETSNEGTTVRLERRRTRADGRAAGGVDRPGRVR